MIARRGLLAGAALAAAVPGRSIATPADLHFNVLRNGGDIGRHNVTFGRDGDALVATVTVEIVVRLGPIPLFRYTHSVRETWRGDRFQSLESETNEDGKRFQVHAIRSEDGVVVDSLGAPRTILAPETIPLTHWNRLCMERPLFNPQDGVAVVTTVVARGEELVPLADGTTVRAAHYSLVGKLALEDWYDTARQWTALRSIGHDGSRIEYRRVI